jgi:cytochrome c peroxidase
VNTLQLCLALGLVGCAAAKPDGASQSTTPWVWDLPEHVSSPEVPVDNPITVEGVALGRVLFHDFQLSVDGGRSCGICHEQKKGFTDGFVKSVGTFGDRHTRNAPTILNVGWRRPLTWRNPDLQVLEEQLLEPLMGTDPIEMGMLGEEKLLLDRLANSEPYPELFAAAYPGSEDPISLDHMIKAVSSYERTLNSFKSPYDDYLSGDEEALGDSALRGLQLFEGEELGCSACHGGLLLDRPMSGDGELEPEGGFFNTGQYNTDGEGSYPIDDLGLMVITGDSADMGAFLTPSLRQVADTGPWNHDGTTATLGAVLDNYARGGRLVGSGLNAGDGADSPYKDSRITGFSMTEDDRLDLLAFLGALSDPTVLVSDPPQDPFCRETEMDPEDCIEPVSFE